MKGKRRVFMIVLQPVGDEWRGWLKHRRGETVTKPNRETVMRVMEASTLSELVR